MAGAALTVDLNARLANFEKGMDQANRALDKLEKGAEDTNRSLAAMSKGAGALAKGLLGALSIGALTAALKSTVQWADNLDNALARTAQSAESLQALRIEAEKFGSSFQATDTALQRFARRVDEARAGSGQLAKVFRAEGVALRNAQGNYRSINALLADYSRVLAKAGDEGERNRLGMAAFDTEGVAFAQTLSTLNGDLETFKENLRDTNQIVSDEAVSALDRLNDAWDEGLSKTAGFIKEWTGQVARQFFDFYDSIGQDGDANAHVTAYVESLNKIGDAAKGVPDLSSVLSVKSGQYLLNEDQLNSAFKRIDTLYAGALDRAEQFRQRVLAIGEPQGLQTFGELDILDVYDGFSKLSSLISSGNTEEAQKQIQDLATAMETLNESADAGTSLAIADIKRAVAGLSDEVFAPKVDRDGVKDAMVTQLVDAQAYARENPLKWEVELDVAGFIDDQATAVGLKP